LDAFESYDWPGNVRQLINALEYTLMTATEGVIKVSDLPDYLLSSRTTSKGSTVKAAIKKDLLVETLNKYQWNRELTARHLGISRVTLWKLMKQMGMQSAN